MLEWVREFVIALGGGTVVLIGMLTICKGLFIKFFESGIESSFEKNLERFKNKMERSTRAYEILLDREMRYYEKIDPIIAEMIILEHKMLYCLHCDKDINLRRQETYDNFCKYFKSYNEQIIALSSESLIHQCYIPNSVFASFSNVIEQMQDDMDYWWDVKKFLYEGKYDAIDYSKGEGVCNKVIELIATAEVIIKKRLQQLCGDKST